MKKVLIGLAVLAQAILLSSLSFGFELEGVAISSDNMQFHGYYEFEYWDAQKANNSFDAHKLVIWMGKDVIKDKVFFSAEIEYEHFPRLEAAELEENEDGDVDVAKKTGGSGEIKLENATVRIVAMKDEAMGDTIINAGIFYVPFGIEWESYPGNKNKLITRPKLMTKAGIIQGTWSDVGVGISHVHPGVATLDLYGINGDARNGGVGRDSDGGNENKSFGARLSFDKIAKGLNFGASYVAGKYDADSELDTTRWGAHLKIDANELHGCPMYSVIIAEYVAGVDEDASSVAGEDKKVSGYYAQFSTRPLAKLDIKELELAVRYSNYDTDTEADEKAVAETSVGLSYILHEEGISKALLKGEYQWNNEEGTEKDNNAAVVALVLNW